MFGMLMRCLPVISTRLFPMLLLSVLVAVPVVRLIPHARKSPFFDRLLWGATVLLAFLGAWFALGYAENGVFAWLNAFVVADLPILALLLGALAGALLLNLSLWVIDLSTPTVRDQEFETDDMDSRDDS